MFTAALFTLVGTWKKPRCPSTEEQIKKRWHIYTMEYYSALKRNEMMPSAELWTDLEIVMQSEVSQKERNRYHVVLLVCGSTKMIQMNLFAKQKQSQM